MELSPDDIAAIKVLQAKGVKLVTELPPGAWHVGIPSKEQSGPERVVPYAVIRFVPPDNKPMMICQIFPQPITEQYLAQFIGASPALVNDLLDKLDTLLKAYENNAKWIAAFREEQKEAENALGDALGMPWFKDDQKNFPGATEKDGVCTGEFTLGTLAQTAAALIKKLTPPDDDELGPSKIASEALQK